MKKNYYYCGTNSASMSVIIDLVGVVSAVVSRVYALCALSLLFVTLPADGAAPGDAK